MNLKEPIDLSLLEFKGIRDLFYRQTGILLNENKKILIINRLSKILNRVCYAIKLFVHEGKLRLKTPER